MMPIKFLTPLLLVSAGLSGCAAGSAPVNGAAASAVTLTIVSKGRTLQFKVEIARTEAEQARGLMYRTRLPSDGGMIFPMDPPRVASFWMKNTVIPLDMIFIRSDGSIARIAENTVPYSLEPVSSGEPVAAVLEIAGGRSSTLGISENDKVAWQR